MGGVRCLNPDQYLAVARYSRTLRTGDWSSNGRNDVSGPDQPPSAEGLDGTASRCAVCTYSGHPGFQESGGVLVYHPYPFGIDPPKGHFQSPVPFRIPLSGIGADIEIDESLKGRALNDPTPKLGNRPSSGEQCPEFTPELQVGARRGLLLHGFIIPATTVLEGIVHTWKWRFKDDADLEIDLCLFHDRGIGLAYGRTMFQRVIGDQLKLRHSHLKGIRSGSR